MTPPSIKPGWTAATDDAVEGMQSAAPTLSRHYRKLMFRNESEMRTMFKRSACADLFACADLLHHFCVHVSVR